MKRILAIDDEVEVTDSIKEIFEHLRYSVDAVNDSLEAVKRCEQDKFDVIITDIRMPRLTGFDVIQKIRDGLLNAKTRDIVKCCVLRFWKRILPAFRQAAFWSAIPS